MGIITDTHGDIKNPPLVYTLFVLRFPIQTALDKHISAMQESLKHTYPIFDKRTQQGIEIVQTQGRQSFSTITKSEYLFFDEDRVRGIIIKEDRILFHSTVYPGFEEFSSWFRDVVQIVAKQLNISHYSGCGIRYIDNIIPDYGSGENLEDYLQKSLLQFDLNDRGIQKNISSIFVNTYASSHGVVAFKSYTLFSDDVGIPPDLQDTASLLRFKSDKITAPFAVLDFDHGYSAPDGTVDKLDLDKLVRKVDEMHNIASRAFLKALKSDAINRWS